jgi:hypothetical protein
MRSLSFTLNRDHPGPDFPPREDPVNSGNFFEAKAQRKNNFTFESGRWPAGLSFQ